MARYVGFVGPSYTDESKIAAYDELYNWYPSRVESGTGTATYALYPTPGFFASVTASDSPGRGMIPDISTITGPSSTATNSFFVSGGTLYEFPSTVRGTGINHGGDAPVSMIWNGIQGHQILIGSEGTTYNYDTTSHALTVVGGGSSVDFLGGYGLRLNSGDNNFEFSASFDFSTWDPLDVVLREDAPDNWLRLIVYHNEVWLFGERTTSIYRLTDDPDIPFQPITSAFMNRGIYAPNSACIVDGTLMWVGAGIDGVGVVYRANGYSAERISTHAMEALLQSSSLGQPASAEGCTYQQNGHVFYEITVPENSPEESGGTFGYTIVYDATEGLWSKRGEWNGLQFQQMDTRGYFSGMSLSRSTGKVYSVITDPRSSSAWLGTNGDPVVRLRRAPHIHQEHKGVVIDTFELYMEVGLGLGDVVSTDPGYDPLIAMRFSNNGGQTWSNTRTVSAGKQGEWNTRPIWTRLGYGRDRIIEVTVSAPVPYRLIDAFVDVRVGPS